MNEADVKNIYNNWRNEALIAISANQEISLLKPHDYVPFHKEPFPVKSIHGHLFHDREYISKVIDEAVECKHVYLQPHALYILDLSHFPKCPYNSLVFQKNDMTIKSRESTSTIIDRFAKTKRLNYNWSKLLANGLGYKQRIPYIIGQDIFVPIPGASDQNASWLALHHIFHVEYDAEKQCCDLYTSDQIHINLPSLTKEFFQKELERCANIYHANNCMRDDVASQMGLTLQPIIDNQKNILYQILNDGGFNIPQYTFSDFYEFLILIGAQDVLSHILQEDNPHLEEVQAYYKIRKTAFLEFFS